MAWTTLSYAFGSLLTSTKMTQMYDNFSALATGASGAPKIQAAALDVLILNPANIASQQAGSFLVHSNDLARTTTSATYVKLKEIKIGAGGTYTVKFALRETSAGVAAYGRIYINDVAVGTEQSASTLTVFSEDISGGSAGDLLQVYGKRGASGECEVSNLGIFVAAPFLFGTNTGY